MELSRGALCELFSFLNPISPRSSDGYPSARWPRCSIVGAFPRFLGRRGRGRNTVAAGKLDGEVAFGS